MADDIHLYRRRIEPTTLLMFVAAALLTAGGVLGTRLVLLLGVACFLLVPVVFLLTNETAITGQSIDETSNDQFDESTDEDELEALKRQYANDEISEEAFERHVEAHLETEEGESNKTTTAEEFSTDDATERAAEKS